MRAARENREGKTSKPASDKQIAYIDALRRDLGVKDTNMPTTSAGASRMIDSLIKRKERADRDAERQRAATRPASLEIQRSIRAMAERLGVEVKPSWLTEGEARFVLDDLRYRERRTRRVADGSAG